MPTAIFSRDFLEEYKSGKRTFSNIILQYADFGGMKFENLTIRNSRLFFVRFRNCDLKNVKFENCEIIYPDFEGEIENTEFRNCTLDLALFENVRFRNTKISGCSISWSVFFDCNMGEADTTGSSLFKVFTDPSQITPSDVEEGMAHLGTIVDSLDLSIRARVKQNLQKEAERLNINIKTAEAKTSMYSSASGYKKEPGAYGAGMQSLMDNVIDAYSKLH